MADWPVYIPWPVCAANPAPQRLPDLPDVLATLHAGALAAHAFDHRAHVFAAWAAMYRHGVVDGASRFRSALRAYTRHLQAAGRYHVTITETMLRLVAAHMRLPAGPARWQAQWHDFERHAAPLFRTSREVMADYYSAERLQASDAARQFVAPDLQALPDTDLDRAGME